MLPCPVVVITVVTSSQQEERLGTTSKQCRLSESDEAGASEAVSEEVMHAVNAKTEDDVDELTMLI